MEREAECIRAVLNFVRGGTVTAGAIIKRLQKDGWSRDEVIQAIVEINPTVKERG